MLQFGVTELYLCFYSHLLFSYSMLLLFLTILTVKTWVLKTVAYVFVDGMLVPVDMSYIL